MTNRRNELIRDMKKIQNDYDVKNAIIEELYKEYKGYSKKCEAAFNKGNYALCNHLTRLMESVTEEAVRTAGDNFYRGRIVNLFLGYWDGKVVDGSHASIEEETVEEETVDEETVEEPTLYELVTLYDECECETLTGTHCRCKEDLIDGCGWNEVYSDLHGAGIGIINYYRRAGEVELEIYKKDTGVEIYVCGVRLLCNDLKAWFLVNYGDYVAEAFVKGVFMTCDGCGSMVCLCDNFYDSQENSKGCWYASA